MKPWQVSVEHRGVVWGRSWSGDVRRAFAGVGWNVVSLGPIASSSRIEDDYLDLESSRVPFDPAVLAEVFSPLGVHGGEYVVSDGVTTSRQTWNHSIDEPWWHRCDDPRALVEAVPYDGPDGSPLFKDRDRKFWLCAAAAGRYCQQRYKGRGNPVFEAIERFADKALSGAELTAVRDAHLANDPKDPWPYYSPFRPHPYPFGDVPSDPPRPFWSQTWHASFARAISCVAFDELRQIPDDESSSGTEFTPDDPAEFERLSAVARATLVPLVRDIFGNPFRPMTLDPSLLQWKEGTVARIAQGIYEERAFERLPILADALIDAGCDDEDILTHCRSGNNHKRGCWALDLLLGKE